MPSARPPFSWIPPTSALFTCPPSVISTTSIVSSSVTRRPLTNCGALPIRFSQPLIALPPPWTTTTFTRSRWSVTTSSSVVSCRAERAPPDLDDDGLPGVGGDVGKRLRERLGHSAMFVQLSILDLLPPGWPWLAPDLPLGPLGEM